MLKIKFIIASSLFILFLIVTSTIKNKTRVIEKNILNLTTKIHIKTKDIKISMYEENKKINIKSLD